MKPYLCVATVVMSLVSVTSFADQPRSILFQDQSAPPSVFDAPQTSEADDSQRECQQMSRKIEQLKGRPQRRSALYARYQAECLERGGDTP